MKTIILRMLYLSSIFVYIFSHFYGPFSGAISTQSFALSWGLFLVIFLASISALFLVVFSKLMCAAWVRATKSLIDDEKDPDAIREIKDISNAENVSDALLSKLRNKSSQTPWFAFFIALLFATAGLLAQGAWLIPMVTLALVYFVTCLTIQKVMLSFPFVEIAVLKARLNESDDS